MILRRIDGYEEQARADCAYSNGRYVVVHNNSSHHLVAYVPNPIDEPEYGVIVLALRFTEYDVAQVYHKALRHMVALAMGEKGCLH